ncbi:MAG: pantoate--beta-alanine ligase [Candidatus Omnitrophota bacterium]
MKVLKNLSRTSKIIAGLKKKGKIVGFVPTMGYLHPGHLSLVHAAQRDCDVVVLSIYINPVQFGPHEDFAKYPRDLTRDLRLARMAGVDIVFLPHDTAIYPPGYLTYVKVEQITKTLCGASRPEHFNGVTTIVAKLFNIIQPDIAYFGQKDAQQAIVVKKMVYDLNLPVKIKVMPTLRDKDGLAMSSRNIYLSPQGRKDALILNQALFLAKKKIIEGERCASKIISSIKKLLSSKGSVTIDYVQIVDTKVLRPVETMRGEILIAIACYIGKTRLIDNIIFAVQK